MQLSLLSWLCAVSLALHALWALPLARAQGADALFEQGQRALAAGHNAEAASAFEASYVSAPRPEALLYLGLAQTGLGRPDLAEHSYAAYLSAAATTADAGQLDAVRAELERLREVNGRLELRVHPKGAQVRVDGAVLRPHDSHVLVTPGLRRIQLEAEGHVPHERRVRVEPGPLLLEVTLAPLEPHTPAASAQVPPAPASPEPAASPAAPSAEAPAGPEPTATEPPQTAPSAPEAVEVIELLDPFESELPPPASGAPPPPQGDDGPCLFGELCFGPVLTLGVANLLGVGLHARYGRLGLGFDAQFVPQIGLGDGKLSAWLLSAPVRVYLVGPFYASIGFAYQSITGKMIDPSGTVTANVRVPALSFGLGVLGRSGLVLGIDAQLGIPLGSKRTRIDAPSDAPQQVVAQAEDLARDVADALPVLLQLNLFRLGYLF